MPTTQALRHQYPEFIVAGVDSNWNVVGDLSCLWSPAVRVPFLASADWGGEITLLVHSAVAEAARALASVMRNHGYQFREKEGGTVSCRKITGGSRTSLHAHGVALDFNPSVNRYRYAVGPIQWGRHTDMSTEMIAAIEAIRTNNGRPVWEWGGRWWNTKDPMHFQPKCNRTDLATGIDWSTVRGSPTNQGEINVLTRGAKGEIVKRYQLRLLGWNPDCLPQHGADADFGAETEAAVKAFQAEWWLPQNGVIDGVVADLLRDYDPERPAESHVHNISHTHVLNLVEMDTFEGNSGVNQ